MLSFEHIEFLYGLLLLLPLAALFILVLRWKVKTRKALGDEELINRLTNNYSSRKYLIKCIAVLLAVALCVVAATNLRKPVKGNQEKTAGIDVMIALDVSKSMLSSDIKPTRLERAKQLVNLIVDKMDGNRTGLVIFAGKAYLQMPVTSDLAEAKMFVSNASVDAVPVQGTVISEALQLCNNSLDTKEKKHKAVILITDGEDHDPNVEKAAQELLDNGVIVYTIGIGTPEGSPIMEPGAGTYKTDINGKTVISKLNEDELKNIAVKTGGEYFRMENVLQTSKDVSNVLNSMEKKLVLGKNGEREYFSFAPFLIALAILLLVAEIFIKETFKEKNKIKQQVAR